MSLAPHARPGAPSSWFTVHAWLFPRGARVLDLACGTGRHALAAAALGCRVTAVDRDGEALAAGRAAAGQAGLAVDWREADLSGAWPDLGAFDLVCCFNYLDRPHIADLQRLVAPGGVLVLETFLTAQRALGWGPTSDDHLLEPGELRGLLHPMTVLFGREVLEPLGGDRWRWVASAIARHG